MTRAAESLDCIASARRLTRTGASIGESLQAADRTLAA
jgi:hypothetical protein